MVIRELYLNRIRPFYDSELVKVITGIRRCGKSTILRQIIAEIKQQRVDDEHIVYVNFEDFKYHRLTAAEAFYEYIEEKITDENKYYLFFDEIQNVNDFELVVNSFRATHNVSIFLTGSNSKLLSGELASHLSGRTVSFKVLPFNFKEFCQYKAAESSDYDKLFEEYMTFGGLPLVCAAQNTETKNVVLSNIYDAVVLKDIVMRNKISSPAALEKILDYVIGNSSLTISGNAIASTLSGSGKKVSAPLVYDYLKYIVDACVCDKVSRYDIRGKKMLAFEEKYYVCDMGFLHLKKNRVKEEYNYIIETICYNELIARGYKVYIGKTWKGEIDFIAERNSKLVYIQAAYMLSDEKTVEREFGAYEKITDNYPKYVLSMDKHTISHDGIIHYNLLDFLLGHVDL
ncbi:ATP-binding protein [uncultured Phascolarctobacterium sp.]|uniref:ATP-binding protein n=1 Tax=uncultured Phascolarctobacterium sp. TaxID=512296 RepID=UPI0025E54257|nr:ATP-binding protein [uncultured Phascolarctobacterium sp.]